MRLAGSEAMLFKFGSGTGTDLSTVRSWKEKLAGGGQPSGPLSFMRVFDQIAGVVKSGGKTRRAAKMQSLQVWHPDDSACNLASINLMKFRREDGSFDSARFQAACRIFLIAQDILVDRASYPTAQIAENSHRFRPLGLGDANLGGLLMSIGVPYDSVAACGMCGCITAIMHATANLTSIEMAGAVAPFADYQKNREPMIGVMKMHRDSAAAIKPQAPADLREIATELWDRVVAEGQQSGFRNAQVTVLAPTGTIGFMMDCTTTGIEPDIALVKYKQLAGGGMLKIVNQTVPMALGNLGYDEPQIKSIIAFLDEHNSIEGSPDLKEDHLAVFDCAFKADSGTRFISWRAHIRMMAAAQPFLSGAISKTVNMPHDVTPSDIADAYQWGWRMGLKAIAIYRDGSKQSQPLSTKDSSMMERKRPQTTQGLGEKDYPIRDNRSPINSILPATKTTSPSVFIPMVAPVNCLS